MLVGFDLNCVVQAQKRPAGHSGRVASWRRVWGHRSGENTERRRSVVSLVSSGVAGYAHFSRSSAFNREGSALSAASNGKMVVSGPGAIRQIPVGGNFHPGGSHVAHPDGGMFATERGITAIPAQVKANARC